MQLRMAQPPRHHLVLLPGLDGTGNLFGPLLASLSDSFIASVARYPNEKPMTDRELFPSIRSVIPWDKPYVLVAESSAGSLALRFAKAQQQNIRALVLVAGFVTNPLPPAQTWLFNKSWFDKSIDAETVRGYLLGKDAPELLVDSVARTFASLRPEVWTWRKESITTLNAIDDIRGCERPILYLRPAEDRVISSEAFDELRRLKPSMKVATLPGPHLLLQRNPRGALEAIREFLERLPAQ
jgi:pimeloyl-ACP methyl ester carboxylesterase